MKAVVTGATGHVGANLVRALLDRGDEVRVLIHSNTAGLDGLDVEVVRGDVLEASSLEAAFAGADTVYHLAALISIQGDLGGKVSRTNIEGPRNVARAALRAGVGRLVHCSSIHAFALLDRSRPVDEKHPRAEDQGGAYDRSKNAGEKEVRKVVAEGLDAVVIHPTGVIGPHDYRPSRMGTVLLQLAHRRLPALLEGGFNWVDARDIAKGALAAAELGRTGESYILSGCYRSVRELAEIASKINGVRAPRLTSPMWLARATSPVLDVLSRVIPGEPLYTSEALAALRGNPDMLHDKASLELGYAPRPLEETIGDTYDWFASVGMLRR